MPIDLGWSDDPAVWLNWIQALTTMVLAVLTGIYVALTRQISAAAVRQADASLKQAEAAAESTLIARQQFDTVLLDAYIPVQAGIAAALGNVRACKITPANVPVKLLPPNFERAASAAERIGASMSSVMRTAEILLTQAQTSKDDLVATAGKLQPEHVQIQYQTGMLKLTLNSVEHMLQATYDEITGTVQRLRESTGRLDITLSNMKPLPDDTA